MAKTVTPSLVLQDLLDKYQINPFSLSKGAHLNYQTVRKILYNQGKITVPTSIKLAKFFGQNPAFWINLQSSYEINELSKNLKFISTIKSISKVEKQTAKTKTAEKPPKRKPKTLAVKRKKAAKVPGARAAKRSKRS